MKQDGEKSEIVNYILARMKREESKNSRSAKERIKYTSIPRKSSVQ